MIEAIVEAIRLAVTKIPEDTFSAIRKAYAEEEDETARFNLGNIIKAIDLGFADRVPVCQDTGTITFFVEAGVESPYLGGLRDLLIEATRRATGEIPLRPNAVDVLTGKNSGDNTGRNVPLIHWEPVPGDRIRIAVLPKGGGSENCSALAMLTPAEGWEGLKRFVVEHVKACGGKPCPPVILGIGVGGGADYAPLLAKKALLRKVGERNPNDKIAKIEEELLTAVNGTGIGPMGMGGRTTALDVRIEVAHRHPASFPVGLVVQCWANRRAFIEIKPDGRVDVWQ
ncbi:fumarate hydratase [Thermococcus thioreducens]|uniref:Fumarase, class I alpha subunit n=1 Tax=Thermococcus thioreducens TaxID=277988 RepID=A0A0Q2URR0_9EURY|nr:fumarate hydratase [Thermococcus thioreducens]ASJ13283.1 fumarate hydratase [Thermococcus thioreducens]KQH83304.1 fumarate hydratase [Thermococcus thioreducens]SEW22065.1 fumarase, class I alpha subunit [Thermococcus thioreducens]